jgi:hypothetical protein
MSLSEPELRLREQRLARREQLLRAREAELSAERCPADRFDALVREFVGRPPSARLPPERARLEPPPGVAPGLLGLWLLASPVVLGFGERGVAWSCVVCGIVVAIAAAIRLSGAADLMISAALVTAGAWLIVSAVWLDGGPRATTDCAVCGVLALVLGLAPLAVRALSSGGRAQRRYRAGHGLA